MKTLKTILILCIAICFATSCKKGVDMTLVQKTIFENADIRQIEVGNAWEVTVIADNNTFVELEYSAYLDPKIKVQMEGTELEIGFTGNTYPAINSIFRAIVHTKQLEKLEADDASKVQCSGQFTGQTIEVDLGDASNCNGLAFVGESCKIKMADASLLTGFQFSGSHCTAELEHASQFNGQIESFDLLEIKLEDASRFVNKGGMTNKTNITLKDASRLNMVETQVNEMQIELTSASEATVWVTHLLEGRMTQASTLYYKGNPQINVICTDGSQLIPF